MPRGIDLDRSHIAIIMGLLRGQTMLSIPPSRNGFWENEGGHLVEACGPETMAHLIEKGIVFPWDDGVHYHYSLNTPLPKWHDNEKVRERASACMLAFV